MKADADALAASLNDTAPSGVAYIVECTEGEQLELGAEAVSPWYVKRTGSGPAVRRGTKRGVELARDLESAKP